MANRPKGYGFTREVQDKIAAKYEPEAEARIVEWVSKVANVPPPNGSGPDAFKAWLDDGLVFKALIDALPDKSLSYKVKNPANEKLEAKKKFVRDENISRYLAACEKIGMPRGDNFQTVDLVEGQNLNQVQNQISSFASFVQKNFPNCVPATLGVKLSTENIREFDEQKLREGRNVSSLQMGTNKVASQAGMTGYGTGRQIIS